MKVGQQQLYEEVMGVSKFDLLLPILLILDALF